MGIAKSKIILTVIIALDVLIVVSFLLLYTYKQKYIVNVRQALFSTMTAADDIFKADPDQLTEHYGFKIEPQQAKEEFYSFLQRVDYVQKGRSTVAGLKNEIQKAKATVLLFQKEDEDKQEFPSLLEKIRTFTKPDVYGDCSDNSAVFMALGSFFGLTVREVHNTVHVFDEIYDHQQQKWIWIDPENAIMARNDKGEYLSLVEMTDRYLKNETITYELFGRNKERDMKKNFFYYYYDSKEKFSYVMMTLGNNIYEVDKLRGKMRFLPKVFGEFMLLASNTKPHYAIFSRNSSVLLQWYVIKYLSILSAAGLVLMNAVLVGMLYQQRAKKYSGGMKTVRTSPQGN